MGVFKGGCISATLNVKIMVIALVYVINKRLSMKRWLKKDMHGSMMAVQNLKILKNLEQFVEI